MTNNKNILKTSLKNNQNNSKRINKTLQWDFNSTTFYSSSYDRSTIKNQQAMWYSTEDYKQFREDCKYTVTFARQIIASRLQNSIIDETDEYCTVGLEHFIDQKKKALKRQRREIVWSAVLSAQQEEIHWHDGLELSYCLPRLYHTVSLQSCVDAQRRAKSLCVAKSASISSSGKNNKRTSTVTTTSSSSCNTAKSMQNHTFSTNQRMQPVGYKSRVKLRETKCSDKSKLKTMTRNTSPCSPCCKTLKVGIAPLA